MIKGFFIKSKFCIFILAVLSLAACLKIPETIKDVSDLEQNHLAYLQDQTKSRDLITLENQNRLAEDYNIIYFSVWHQREPFYALPATIDIDSKRFAANFGYGENKRKHTGDWYKKLLQNAALDNYPNALYRAITVRNTNLRALPTERPHFNKPGGDSDGWPFDNLQRSSVAANTPIFVCHLSADQTWALVETSFTFGWMPVEDFGRVDDNFIKEWESGRYAVITRDQTGIFYQNGQLALKSSLGYRFPLVGETQKKLEILVAAKSNFSDCAVIKKSYVARDAAAVAPLRLTSLNVVKIANELIGEPYGWGGLYGNRDCSSMTRDFFSVFGLWLPRHSEDQVKEAGTYIDLKGMTSEQKEKVIMEKAIPYLTLIWRKGHVMLYIGAKDGQPLIFHNVWGVRTKDLRGFEGRKIIGQAVITTLHPGRELRNFDAEAGDLLTHVAGMSILAPQQ
ncbi:MAG: hydrolase Nlp/P60 [Syntrophaceae bacterium]|nr:hydrolase Nlp/P60 [Syntrophaceae bacterium]